MKVTDGVVLQSSNVSSMKYCQTVVCVVGAGRAFAVENAWSARKARADYGTNLASALEMLTTPGSEATR